MRFVAILAVVCSAFIVSLAAPPKDTMPKAPSGAAQHPTLEEGLPVGEFYAIAFSPNGRYLATGVRWSAQFGVREERSVDIFDSVTGRFIGVYLPRGLPYEGTPVTLAFSPKGQFLAVGGMDHQVYLWDVLKAKLVRMLKMAAPVETVAFSPDGKLLAIGGWNGHVTIFQRQGKDWQSPKQIWVQQVVKGDLLSPPPKLPSLKEAAKTIDMLRLKNPPFVKAVVFDPKGRWLAVAGTGEVIGSKEGIIIFSVPQWRKLAVLKGHGHGVDLKLAGKAPVPWVNDLAVSKDGRFLASAGWDGTVRLWDMTKKEQVRRFDSPKTPLGRVATRIYNAVSISPDNRFVAAGGILGNQVDVWDLKTARHIVSLKTENMIETVAFSPDGKRLMVGGWDGLLRAWQVGSWRLLWQKSHNLLTVSTPTPPPLR